MPLTGDNKNPVQYLILCKRSPVFLYNLTINIFGNVHIMEAWNNEVINFFFYKELISAWFSIYILIIKLDRQYDLVVNFHVTGKHQVC